MFVILWEFEVKPGSDRAFAGTNGPQGDWVRLFQRDPHYRMTYLLKDTSRPRFYFTMDLWDSEGAYENFISANRESYDALDQSSEGLTLRERFIGAFLQSDTAIPSP